MAANLPLTRSAHDSATQMLTTTVHYRLIDELIDNSTNANIRTTRRNTRENAFTVSQWFAYSRVKIQYFLHLEHDILLR